MAYEIKWTDEAKADMQRIPIFHRKPIYAAVQRLRHQASVDSRNRKPFAEALEGNPTGAWQIRIGDYRVLYWIEEEQTVHVLRAIFKGSGTTEDALERGGTS
jgi:addiction module RelE/StbE family toxin